jgi:AAA+ ATPase superfamily predicted ATPase
MGKTGLIHHVFHHMSKKDNRIPVYFDIMGTTGFNEFAEVFCNAVLQSMSRSERAWKGFLKKLVSLRPALAFDSLTGEPRISLDIRSREEVELTLDSVFRLMEEKKQSFTIAIDEFQQISSYPEQHVEAVLRSHIQKQTHTSFIFSGSKKHMLSAMFSKPSRPFFNSTQMMFLESIGREPYFDFISAHFSNREKQIDKDALERIEAYTQLHTFYVQYLCNRLFSIHKKVGAGDVDKLLYTILRENEPIYASYLNLLTIIQYKTLRAIAMEGVVESPTAGSFLAKHQLGAASSVAQAVSSLTKKEFIHNDSGRLSVQDKFLAQWIRNK